jgi:hypothetical protein
VRQEPTRILDRQPRVALANLSTRGSNPSWHGRVWLLIQEKPSPDKAKKLFRSGASGQFADGARMFRSTADRRSAKNYFA